MSKIGTSTRSEAPIEPLDLRVSEPLIVPLVPPAIRRKVALLWALDARLGVMARSGREPALRQIRLRWWSEQIAAAPDVKTPGEPLLQEVRAELGGVLSLAEVAALAELWMAEALEERGAQAAERGAALFDLTAQLWPSDGKRRDDFDPSLYRQAGRGWAMVDALLGGRVPVAAAAWSEAARQFDGVRINQFPRALAALTGLARRVALAGGARSRRHEQLLLLRIGLLGR